MLLLVGRRKNKDGRKTKPYYREWFSKNRDFSTRNTKKAGSAEIQKGHVKKTYTVHIKVSIINKSSQRNHFSKMFLFLQSRLKNIYILITISGD